MDNANKKAPECSQGKPAFRPATVREESARVEGERPCNIQGVPMTLASGTQARASLPLTLEEKAPADSTGENPRPQRKESDEDRGIEALRERLIREMGRKLRCIKQPSAEELPHHAPDCTYGRLGQPQEACCSPGGRNPSQASRNPRTGWNHQAGEECPPTQPHEPPPGLRMRLSYAATHGDLCERPQSSTERSISGSTPQTGDEPRHRTGNYSAPPLAVNPRVSNRRLPDNDGGMLLAWDALTPPPSRRSSLFDAKKPRGLCVPYPFDIVGEFHEANHTRFVCGVKCLFTRFVCICFVKVRVWFRSTWTSQK